MAYCQNIIRHKNHLHLCAPDVEVAALPMTTANVQMNFAIIFLTYLNDEKPKRLPNEEWNAPMLQGKQYMNEKTLITIPKDQIKS